MEGGVTDSEEEEEEKAVTPCVPRAPKSGPTYTSQPQDSLTSVEPETSPDLSFQSVNGNSNGDNTYTSLTSHTTATESISADSQSTEVNPLSTNSITESQFSPVMPYQEDLEQTSSEVFTEISSTKPHTSQQTNKSLNTSNEMEITTVTETPPQSPRQIPGKSTRSTRGMPSVHFGNIITHCVRVSNVFDNPVYKNTLFVSSIPTVCLI